jgi:hypothetical protein
MTLPPLTRLSPIAQWRAADSAALRNSTNHRLRAVRSDRRTAAFGCFRCWALKAQAIFLGASEWTYGSLLLLGFWNKKLGALGAFGATLTFLATFTIMPFAPGAWDAAAGGFPAMTIVSGFLLKDLVLLVVSVYLLKQDLARVVEARCYADRGRN